MKLKIMFLVIALCCLPLISKAEHIPVDKLMLEKVLSDLHVLQDQLKAAKAERDKLEKQQATQRIELYDCAYRRKTNPNDSGYWNGYDDEFSEHCPDGEVMTGMHSTHNNNTEDRLFKFNCCKLRVVND